MNFDAIIVGGGHNGLTCAAMLAAARKKVLVLERRGVLGGAAATEAVFPRCNVNVGAHDAGLFLPEIIEKLGLHNHGLQVFQSDAAVFAPQPDGSAIALWRNHERTIAELRRFYPDDALKISEFNQFMNRMSKVMRLTLMLTPPEFGHLNPADLMAWVQPAIKLKQFGRKDMMAFLRVLPLSVSDLLDEWFTSEALKGLLSFSAVASTGLGPMAAGTAFNFIYQYTGRENGGFQSSWFIRGGMGKLSDALGEYIRSRGGEVRVNTPVAQIFVNDQDEAVGIRLESGEKLFANVIVANTDPRTTFFKLVGAPYLTPRFVRQVQNIRFRAGMAKMNLLLNRLPSFPAAENNLQQLSGHITISPSVEYLERAADAAKYGDIPPSPALDIVIPTIMDASLVPEGKHLLSVNIPYVPYQLEEGNWDSRREELQKNILKVLASYASDIPDIIADTQLITPQDWESEFGLTEGDGYHGQMALDQLLFMRPVAGWGRYQTPVHKLYLCGAGTHPGGGVTGAPGYNAAREILKHWRK